MDTPVAVRPAARPDASGPGDLPDGPPALPWRRGLALVAACVAVATASVLLGPWALAFDPQVWLIWGRDAARGALDMDAGPSWKPLTVVITTALAPLGDGAHQEAWLVVARSAGLLAVAGAWVLGRRLGGRVAGAAAALLIVAGPWWGLHTALGNSEGLLAAVVLWAVVAGLDGRQGWAMALAFAAGLLRPEVWPFLALHAAWLWRAEPARRPAIVASLGTLAVAWLLPDVLGLGGALQASEIARGVASPESAANEAVPGLAVLADAAGHLAVVGVVAAAAAVAPWRSAAAPLRWIAAAALAYVALVALAAQGGYAGNPRYLVPATALGAVLAGVGIARGVRAVAGRRQAPPADVGIARGVQAVAGRRQAPPADVGIARGVRAVAGRGGALPAVAALLALVAVLIPLRLGGLREDAREVAWRAEQREGLDLAVARAGGATALVGCGTVRTAHLTRALVAWRLELPLLDIDTAPRVPGVLLRSHPVEGAPLEPPVPRGLEPAARAPGWEVWRSCAP